MKLSDKIKQTMEREEEEKAAWAAIQYVNMACPKCSRARVELCRNGKLWCEKCNWVVNDKQYFIPVWRI